MKYERVEEGVFVDRPNRFIAHVLVNGETQVCHVKNTGRCRELLVPGARVILSRGTNPQRKTAFDLVSVYKGDRLINMDSQAPNDIAAEYLPALFPDLTELRREVTYGSSRFDFCGVRGGRPFYLEVKGVTLEQADRVYFPDAPTERGLKHLKELTRLCREGTDAYVLFIVQMERILSLQANRATHPAFADALQEAHQAGVQVLAVDCRVTPDSVTARRPVPVEYV